MSYEPTTWKSGDTVTSAKLNKMEQGIASAGGVNILVAHLINSSEDDGAKEPSRAASQSGNSNISGTLDVTLEEIENADFTIIKFTTDNGVGNAYIAGIAYDEDYNCYALGTAFVPGLGGALTFFATNGDDYPTTSFPEEIVPPDVPSDGGGGR